MEMVTRAKSGSFFIDIYVYCWRRSLINILLSPISVDDMLMMNVNLKPVPQNSQQLSNHRLFI